MDVGDICLYAVRIVPFIGTGDYLVDVALFLRNDCEWVATIVSTPGRYWIVKYLLFTNLDLTQYFGCSKPVVWFGEPRWAGHYSSWPFIL